MKYKIMIKIGILLFFINILCYSAVAFSLLPSQFYGKLTIDGEHAPAGTEIAVYDKNRVLCGMFITEKNGEYIISCRGDNPDTGNDEGANEDESISFMVNNLTSYPDIKWHGGSFQNIDVNFKTNQDTIPNANLSPKILSPEQERLPAQFLITILLILGVFVFILMGIRNKMFEGI